MQSSPGGATPQAFDRFVVMPYADEIAQLPASYTRALEHDVSEFAGWLRAQRDRSLVAVGAGGSLSVAQLAAQLHEQATGRVSRACEPMDVYLAPRPLSGAAVLQVTAGGSHGDAPEIARMAQRWSDRAGIFCGVVGSLVAREFAGDIPVFAFPLLPATHGWVAVNVLLGQAVVLLRAYHEAFPDVVGALPPSLDVFLEHGATVEANTRYWASEIRDVLARPALFCLFGPETRALAIDLDSKFAESGLGELNLSEYRNFAHGRYQSLLSRRDEIGVIAFYTPREAAIALDVDESLGGWVPHAAVPIGHEGVASYVIAQLVQLFVIVGALSEVRGADVGWGSRNSFGDPLYERVPATPPLPCRATEKDAN
jgi:hypothetical protein